MDLEPLKLLGDPVTPTSLAAPGVPEEQADLGDQVDSHWRGALAVLEHQVLQVVQVALIYLVPLAHLEALGGAILPLFMIIVLHLRQLSLQGLLCLIAHLNCQN